MQLGRHFFTVNIGWELCYCTVHILSYLCKIIVYFTDIVVTFAMLRRLINCCIIITEYSENDSPVHSARHPRQIAIADALIQ